MRATSMRFVIGGALLLSVIGLPGRADAQIGLGTWVRTDVQGKGMSMTVEACCNGGRRLIYHIAMPGQPVVTMTVKSPMNGTEVPTLVDGKPSGQMMAITRVDDHHYKSVMKANGTQSGTSSATLSADGRTLTVESFMGTGRGSAAEKVIETWVRK